MERLISIFAVTEYRDGRGRDAGYPAPPAPIPACSTTAPGVQSASAPSQSPMAGLPTRPARSLSTLHRPRYRGPRMTRSQCGLGEAAGRRRLQHPPVCCQLSYFGFRGQIATAIRRANGFADTQITGDYTRPSQGASEKPLRCPPSEATTPSGRRSLRRLAGHVARLNRASLATAVASATMYSALRVVNCKARRGPPCTAARRSAARLKTW